MIRLIPIPPVYAGISCSSCADKENRVYCLKVEDKKHGMGVYLCVECLRVLQNLLAINSEINT